jgi:hypothetical protein
VGGFVQKDARSGKTGWRESEYLCQEEGVRERVGTEPFVRGEGGMDLERINTEFAKVTLLHQLRLSLAPDPKGIG